MTFEILKKRLFLCVLLPTLRSTVQSSEYEFPLVSSERALKGGKGEQSSSRTVYWAIGLTISGKRPAFLAQGRRQVGMRQ